MGKKLFFLITMISILLISGCMVNEKTGRIKLVNLSDISVTNILLDDTFILGFLAPGASSDYWFFDSDIEKVVPKASGFTYVPDQGDNVTFKLNYHGRIEFKKIELSGKDSYLIYVNQGEKQGAPAN